MSGNECHAQRENRTQWSKKERLKCEQCSFAEFPWQRQECCTDLMRDGPRLLLHGCEGSNLWNAAPALESHSLIGGYCVIHKGPRLKKESFDKLHSHRPAILPTVLASTAAPMVSLEGSAEETKSTRGATQRR